MSKKFAALLMLLTLAAVGVSAQGLDTRASKDDWEEINFEYNSSVLVDGFPSLLRLAELLQKNPGYKVKVEGHTDIIGGGQYNTKLGMARATTVRDFLVKYGARASQIALSTRGKAEPKYPGQKSTYTKTDEARWMNRRVVITVTDEQGRTVSAAGVGEAIRAIEPPKPAIADCCAEVLKRLDKLDDIARMLQGLNDQNAALRKEIDALRQNQQVIESKVNQPQPKPPTTEEVAGAVAKELDKRREPRFALLGANVGVDQNGDVTFSGKGRFFGPFGEHFAFQAQAEYLAFRGQKEGQIDIGLVDRMGRFQAGLFSSFKHVTLSGNQSGATLGQASLTLDYIFKWGRVGLFGAKGFMDNGLINSVNLVSANGVVLNNVFQERYLKIVDQLGASASIGLWGHNYLEANLGYLKSALYGDARAGGTLRFVFPLNTRVALTLEGGLNETMLSASNSGRAVVGVQFGNMIRPREFMTVNHAVPVDVPRVRYEILTRTRRVGHTPPVADAGPDQIGVPAGTITLNGSASYSPDDLPITYRWIQEGGQAVNLTNPTGAITSFTAGAGQSYIFRLVVTDSLGGQGSARVHISTAAADRANILFFIADPTQIQPGGTSTLSWRVVNATSITISGLGSVPASGSRPVSPTVTTTYTLTASNAVNSETASVTVRVSSGATKLLFCYASPTNILLGESATLFYQSQNATSVTISPSVGAAVGLGGSVAVTPTQSTTYTITATGPAGTTPDTCSVAVRVTTGALPRIIRFSAIPAGINSGQSSTLVWVVENATKVNIDPGIGTVSLDGTRDVTPAATTTYTLTATNAAGSVTAQATVTVGGGPKITSFTATPNPSPSSGSAVVLACQATNATSINIAGNVTAGATATFTVRPTATTTYTCIATAQNGQTDQQTLTVTVGGAGGPGPVIVIAGGTSINTFSRFITLDASGSTSPAGNLPLTFKWVSVNDRALVLNANSPTPNIQLGFFADVYLFNLTVTDSKGNSSTATVAVRLTL